MDLANVAAQGNWRTSTANLFAAGGFDQNNPTYQNLLKNSASITELKNNLTAQLQIVSAKVKVLLGGTLNEGNAANSGSGLSKESSDYLKGMGF
jgi:hypothetical protein